MRRPEPHVRRGRSSRRSIASRPRPCTTRSTDCRVPSACRSCSATSRASRSTRRRERLRLAGRDAAQPAGPGAREAPPRADAPRRRACPHALAAALAPRSGLGVRLIPPVRHDHPGRDRTSRPDRPPRGASRPATALAQEVLRSMLIHKLKAHRAARCCSSAPSPPARGI